MRPWEITGEIEDGWLREVRRLAPIARIAERDGIGATRVYAGVSRAILREIEGGSEARVGPFLSKRI